ncbi:MAG: DUF1016 N-terminal domain-containing protein [Crocinitomicaceae bacterium]
MTNTPTNPKFFSQVVQLLQSSRSKVVQTINQTMVLTYFEIGKMIVEEEQNGEERAEYGKKLLEDLSVLLTREFGKGFSKTNLKQMRQFYLIYSIGQTVSDQFNLSWSHYLKLMRIDNQNKRKFYEIEAFKNNWSIRELQRQ